MSCSRLTPIAILSLCLLAAPAQAATLKRLDSSIGGATTDGSRYAAYIQKAGHARIADTAKQTTVEWPVDKSCSFAYEGSAGGDALLACQASDGFTYAVLGRTTGAVSPLPSTGDASASAGYTPGLDFLYGIGTQWVAGGREQMTSTGGNYEVPLFVNRSTGERRLGGADAIDLNSSAFAPLRGRCGPSDWWVTSSDPNYALIVGANGHLVLRHCSGAAILATFVLSTCPSGCTQLHFSAGIATWLERGGRLARAYTASKKAFCVWSVAAKPAPGLSVSFDHTAKAVFATVPAAGTPPPTTIYTAPLPC